MAETHVISALVDKRARLKGEVEACRYQIMRLEIEIAHVDATIRMFKPTYDIDKIATKRSFAKNPAGVEKSAGGRQALTVLRESGAALTANEIAGRVLARLGKPDTPDARRMLSAAITSTFTRRKGGAVTYDASTWPGRWSLAT